MMSDDLERFVSTQAPSPERPLQGMTVLVVEDSRFASEAIRLLCLRSGARIRRADSLAAAHRHLGVYRPSVVIVDMGLPDGSGADLIRELDRLRPRMTGILGMSGDDGMEARAMAAGADGFLAKPVDSLAAFQRAVLSVAPTAGRPQGLRLLSDERIAPDRVAYRDDLVHVADVIRDGPEGSALDYIAQFLAGVARSADDAPLAAAAAGLAQARAAGRSTGTDLALVAGLVQARLEPGLVI